MAKIPKDTPTPLSQARGLLSRALGGTPIAIHTPEPPVAVSSGSQSLDALIGADRPGCEGYPGGKITDLYTTQEHYDALLTAVVQSSKAPVTLITKRPLPGVTPVPDLQHAVTELWLAANQKEGLVVLDDVQFEGPKFEGPNAAAWSVFLPKLMVRLSKNRNLGFVRVSFVSPDAGPSGYSVGGEKVWKYYSSVRALFTPLPIRPKSFFVTLHKNKISSSQGRSGIVSLNDGRFDEDATALVTKHLGGVRGIYPSELLRKLAGIPELEAGKHEEPSFLLQGNGLGFPQGPG